LISVMTPTYHGHSARSQGQRRNRRPHVVGGHARLLQRGDGLLQDLLRVFTAHQQRGVDLRGSVTAVILLTSWLIQGLEVGRLLGGNCAVAADRKVGVVGLSG